MPCSWVTSVSLKHPSSLKTAPARHAASTVADELGSPGHCLSSTSVLPLPKALHHIYTIHTQYTHLHQMAMNFHQCNTLYTQKWKRCILQTFDNFSSRSTTLNWLYKQYDTFKVPSHDCMIIQIKYMHLLYMKSIVRWYHFTSDMLLPLFFNFFIITNLVHKFLVHSHKLRYIKFLYMFRAQSAHHQDVNDANCTYAASGIVTLCKWPSCATAKAVLP